jgi:DNA polymerase III subunit beta
LRFTCHRTALTDAISVATKGVSPRSTLPILTGILIKAEEGKLVLHATDLEVAVRHELPAEVETQGSIVVPARLFADVVRALPEEEVVFDTASASLAVTCGSAEFSMRVLAAEDFPRFPEVSPEQQCEVPASTFAEVAKQVLKAVSKDETRPVITGVLLSVEGSTLRMVATDSYRLAIRDAQLAEPVAQPISAIVPAKALEEAARVVGEGEPIQIGMTQNQVIFSTGSTTFVSRLIEGSFPKYEQLIPAESETKVVLDRDAFLAAVRRVSLFAQHSASLRVAVIDTGLRLSAATQDIGEASETIAADVGGEPVEIAFNHAYLIDGLTSVPDDEIVLEITSPLKPGLIRGAQGEFTYLVMPIRIG